MAHLMTDVERRLRATRPPLDDEPDLALLARVTAAPVPRQRRPVVAPAVAVAALALAVFVVVSGSRPEPASAISQALEWFDPPTGTVLHSRVVYADGGVREFWQDADHPERSRFVETGGVEVGPGAVYDPATNRIYLDSGTGKGPDPKADARKRARLRDDPQADRGVQPAGHKGEPEPKREPAAGRTKPDESLLGDPVVNKVRTLLADRRATVRGREQRNGVDAWAIELAPGADRATWTLWVRADNGKPLALHDPGDPVSGNGPEDAQWDVYEVLDASAAPLTLRAAHPDAQVVRDGERYGRLLANLR